MNDPKFRISYQMDAVLSVKNLWPDGNAPENPTEEDVLKLIDNDGGILDVIHKWNLDSYPYLNMDVVKVEQ